MSTAREPHILVVAIDPDGMEPGHVWSPEHRKCEACNDLPFTLTIECPGVAVGGCNLWEECDTCRDALKAIGDDDVSRDAYMDQVHEGTAHGIEHMTFGGAPCVETSGCFVIEAHVWGYLDDDLWDIARVHGPGRYRLGWDGGEMDEATAYLDEPAEVTR